MPPAELQELDRLIRRLKRLAEQAYQASHSIPAAEKNLYMVLRHLEMLEIEICDPLSVLAPEAASEIGDGDETSAEQEPGHAAASE